MTHPVRALRKEVMMSSGSCKQGREQERGEGAIRGGLEMVGTGLKSCQSTQQQQGFLGGSARPDVWIE